VEAPSTTQPSIARKLWHEALSTWQLGLSNLLARWWQMALIIGIGVILVLVDGGGIEHRLLQEIRQADNDLLTANARWLSWWGDIRWALIIAGTLFAMGIAFGRPRLRQIAWAMLFAILASTVLVNLFRGTLGRARPNTEFSATFHGPHLKKKGFGLDHKYLAFPSGHASSAFAPAAAIAAAAPMIGVPCVIFASGVGWSRMQLNQHRPLDVMTGAALGTFIGLCFGTAVPGAKVRMRGKKPGP
jgi:membrane-associated phospholipid phosphatase